MNAAACRAARARIEDVPRAGAAHRDLAVLSAGCVVDDDGADARGDAQLVVARARHAELQHAVQQPDPAFVPPAGKAGK